MASKDINNNKISFDNTFLVIFLVSFFVVVVFASFLKKFSQGVSDIAFIGLMGNSGYNSSLSSRGLQIFLQL